MRYVDCFSWLFWMPVTNNILILMFACLFYFLNISWGKYLRETKGVTGCGKSSLTFYRKFQLFSKSTTISHFHQYEDSSLSVSSTAALPHFIIPVYEVIPHGRLGGRCTWQCSEITPRGEYAMLGAETGKLPAYQSALPTYSLWLSQYFDALFNFIIGQCSKKMDLMPNTAGDSPCGFKHCWTWAVCMVRLKHWPHQVYTEGPNITEWPLGPQGLMTSSAPQTRKKKTYLSLFLKFEQSTLKFTLLYFKL